MTPSTIPQGAKSLVAKSRKRERVQQGQDPGRINHGERNGVPQGSNTGRKIIAKKPQSRRDDMKLFVKSQKRAFNVSGNRNYLSRRSSATKEFIRQPFISSLTGFRITVNIFATDITSRWDEHGYAYNLFANQIAQTYGVWWNVSRCPVGTKYWQQNHARENGVPQGRYKDVCEIIELDAFMRPIQPRPTTASLSVLSHLLEKLNC